MTGSPLCLCTVCLSVRLYVCLSVCGCVCRCVNAHDTRARDSWSDIADADEGNR